MRFDLAVGPRSGRIATTEGDRHADFQKIAPEVEAGLYLVPRVIE